MLKNLYILMYIGDYEFVETVYYAGGDSWWHVNKYVKIDYVIVGLSYSIDFLLL